MVLVGSHSLSFRREPIKLYRQIIADRMFAPQLRFKRCELRLDILLGLTLANDLLAIAAQEIVDGFHSNANRSRWLVFVEILKTEIRSSGLLDDAFDHSVDRRVVPALETGNFERHQIGVARSKFRRPDFVIRTARIGILPGIGNVERMAGNAGSHFLAEQALQQVFVLWQSILRKNRIAKLLELLENLVIQAGIVMVGTSQHHNTDAVFALQLVQYLAGTIADIAFVVFQRSKSSLNRPVVFLLRQSEN